MERISKSRGRVFQAIFIIILAAALAFSPTLTVAAQSEEPPAAPPAAEPSPAENPPSPDVPEAEQVEDSVPPVDAEPEEPVVVDPADAGEPPVDEAPPAAEEPLPQVVAVMDANQTVLVDEGGEVLPLAAQEAAGILAGARDPWFTANDGSGVVIGYTGLGGTCNAAVAAENCHQVANPIQAAIDDPLSTGQVVSILAGDYAEDVTINKSVTLQGVADAGLVDAVIRSITLQTDISNWNHVVGNTIFVNPGVSISDAVAIAASGGKVSLGAGVFEDDFNNGTGIFITKPLEIEGQGAGATILQAGTPACNQLANNHCSNAFLISSSHVTIHDLTLDGQNQQNNGIATFAGFDHIVISNSTIKNMTEVGINISRSEALISGNNIHNNGTGIVFTDVGTIDHNLKLEYNRIVNNHEFGLEVNDFTGNRKSSVADNNWWGCSSGPSRIGCPTAISPINLVEITSNLLLGLSASPDNILAGETSTLTPFLYASSDTNRTPVTGLHWFDPPPYVTLMDPMAGTLDNGLFTAKQVGTHNFSVLFDTVVATAQIQVVDPPCEGAGETRNPETGQCEAASPGPKDEQGKDSDVVLPGGPLVLSSVIPVTGLGGMNSLSCTQASALMLDGGSRVTFSKPLCGYAAGLTPESGSSLPAPLPDEFTFAAGLTLTLQNGAQTGVNLPEDVTARLSFGLPNDTTGLKLTVLAWDASMAGGLGGWVELPGTATGEAQIGGSGTFILAYR